MSADIVDEATRSRMMSGIRGEHTKPELIVRRSLHRLGFRFRLHPRNLPGRPDIVLPKYGIAIFVHGCFWHRHQGCKYTTTPKTRREFWEKKFQANLERDQRKQQQLIEAGWRVLTVWECALKMLPEESVNKLASVIRNDDSLIEELPDPAEAEWIGTHR